MRWVKRLIKGGAKLIGVGVWGKENRICDICDNHWLLMGIFASGSRLNKTEIQALIILNIKFIFDFCVGQGLGGEKKLIILNAFRSIQFKEQHTKSVQKISNHLILKKKKKNYPYPPLLGQCHLKSTSKYIHCNLAHLSRISSNFQISAMTSFRIVISCFIAN